MWVQKAIGFFADFGIELPEESLTGFTREIDSVLFAVFRNAFKVQSIISRRSLKHDITG